MGLTDWKQFKTIARRHKKFVRMVNQAKLKAFRNRTVCKFGVQVPINHAHTMELDAKNKNKMWYEAEGIKLGQIDEYETFRDVGKNTKQDGYRKITVHMVYDMKHDGRRKTRLVAGGHLTGPPLESVYSGIVSLGSLRIVLFLAELNGLHTWATNRWNAYLEAKMREKEYIIAGPELREQEGHTLIIDKALYGLKLNEKMLAERCSDILLGMDFVKSRTEDDIWKRDMNDHYEYIARYADDLVIASKNPQAIIDSLQGDYNLKLKGSGPTGYHLGCDFFRDS